METFGTLHFIKSTLFLLCRRYIGSNVCLSQVQHYLKLSQETLYISISLLDTILERRDVEPDKLQLVGITALYLGSKMEEYYPADVKKLLHLTENSYAVRDVFDMELVLLGVICFQVKQCHEILSC